jgi:hypothetical protein
MNIPASTNAQRPGRTGMPKMHAGAGSVAGTEIGVTLAMNSCLPSSTTLFETRGRPRRETGPPRDPEMQVSGAILVRVVRRRVNRREDCVPASNPMM